MTSITAGCGASGASPERKVWGCCDCCLVSKGSCKICRPNESNSIGIVGRLSPSVGGSSRRLLLDLNCDEMISPGARSKGSLTIRSAAAHEALCELKNESVFASYDDFKQTEWAIRW